MSAGGVQQMGRGEAPVLVAETRWEFQRANRRATCNFQPGRVQQPACRRVARTRLAGLRVEGGGFQQTNVLGGCRNRAVTFRLETSESSAAARKRGGICGFSLYFKWHAPMTQVSSSFACCAESQL